MTEPNHRTAAVARPVSRLIPAKASKTPKTAPITWQTARCEATATGWITNAVIQYFIERVEEADECWMWTGSCYGNGYGRLRCQPNPSALAHRVAYELWVGPIPSGLTIDHLCRNTRCVNPAHLEAVTITENVRRSVKTQAQRATTHCPYGHEYSQENTRVYKGMRSCRTCARERDLVYQALHREKRREACRARYYAKTGRTVPDQKRACGPRWDGSKSQQALARRRAA